MAMIKKIAKGLWIHPQLADDFDSEVERLSALVPGRLETGEVGAAALLTFIRLSDKRKLEALKEAKSYTLDRIIEQLPPDTLAEAPEPLHVLDGMSEQADPCDNENPHQTTGSPPAPFSRAANSQNRPHSGQNRTPPHPTFRPQHCVSEPQRQTVNPAR